MKESFPKSIIFAASQVEEQTPLPKGNAVKFGDSTRCCKFRKLKQKATATRCGKALERG
jgi:hypothetical protein